MKPKRNPLLSTTACGAALIALAAIASGAEFYWDVDTVTPFGQNGDGFWTSDIANTNWAATAGGTPNIPWVNGSTNTAFLGSLTAGAYTNPATGGTITLGENITTFAVSMSGGQSGSYIINGGGFGLTLAGVTPYLGNNNSTATLTINAVISGTAGVAKNNNGKVILTAENDYSGTTLINAGTLAYGASNIIADGPVTLNGANAVLDLGANQSDTVGTVTVNGGGSIIGTGSSALTTTGTFEMMNGSVSAILAGGVALNKTGTGTAKLSGANTYTGVTTVSAGSLQFANPAALYGGNTANWTTANLVVLSGAALSFNVGGAGEFTATDIDFLKVLGGESTGFTSGSSLGLDTSNTAGGVFTYASDIEDPDNAATTIGISKYGTNALVLSGNNTYSGPTNIFGGALSLTTDGANLNPNSNMVLTNGVLETNGTLALTVGTSGGNVQWTAQTGKGGFSAVGAPLGVTLNGGVQLSWSASAGTSKFGAAALVFGSPNANNKVTLTNNISLNFTRTVQVDAGAGGDSAELSGILLHVDGGITKTGTGLLILSGANTFGSTNAINAGTLEIRHNTALGNTTGATTIAAANGSLALGNNITVAENIALSARDSVEPQLQNFSGDNTLTGTLTWNAGGGAYRVVSNAGKLTINSAVNPAGGNKTLHIPGDGDVELGGVISNTANLDTTLTLNKSGGGTLTLSNTASTYTGATRVNGGVLVVSSLANAGSPSSIGQAADFSFNLVLNGGTLRHVAPNVAATNKKFAVGLGGATIDSSAVDPANIVNFTTNLAMGFNSELGARTLTLTGSNTGSNAMGLQLMDDTSGNPTSLVKEGPGTWRLTYANSYTGGTTVSEGTLVITSNNALDDNATVTIADGATLNLTHSGTDIVGALVINDEIQDPGFYTFGTGQLQVVGSGTPFETWADDKGLDGTAGKENGPGDDPDNDGSSNLAEFAINGNPLSGSDNGRIFSLKEDSSDVGSDKELILTIAVRTGTPAFAGSPSPSATVDGITYTIQGSTNLAAFATQAIPVDPVTTDLTAAGDGYEYRSFSLDGSNGLTGKGFLRLQIAQP